MTPVLMLITLDVFEQRTQGLRFGSDDYLTKPFAFVERIVPHQPPPARIGYGLAIEKKAVERRSKRLEVEPGPVDLVALPITSKGFCKEL